MKKKYLQVAILLSGLMVIGISFLPRGIFSPLSPESVSVEQDMSYENTSADESDEDIHNPVEESTDLFIPDYEPGQENLFGVNEGANISQSFMVTQGEWKYFLFNGSLYKQHGDNQVNLLKSDLNTPYPCINVSGDYIYYFCIENSEYVIQRIRTDGSQCETLVTVEFDSYFNYPFIYDKEENCIWYCTYAHKNSSVMYPSYGRYDIDTGVAQDNLYVTEPYNDYVPENLILVGIDSDYVIAYEDYEDISLYNIALIDRNTGIRTTVFAKPVSDFVHPSSLVYKDSKVYYSADTSLFAEHINVLDLKTKEILETQDIASSIFPFYIHPQGYILLKTSGSCTLLQIDKFPELYGFDIMEDWPKEVTVIDDWIYYTAENNDEELMMFRVKIDGSNWEIFMT